MFLNDLYDYIDDNKSGVALGAGIFLGVLSTVLAVKHTKKALENIEDAKKDIPEGEELPLKTVVKVCWKEYVPTALAMSGSIACLIFGKTIDNKRIMAISAAYNLTSEFSRLYGEKVKEQLGEEKNAEIKKEARKELGHHVKRYESEYVSLFDGDQYFKEPYSGKIFVSSTVKLDDAVNRFNDKLNNIDEAPLYDIWEAICDASPIPLNERLLEGDLTQMLGFLRKNGLIGIEYNPPEHDMINGNKIAYTPIRFVDKKHNKYRDPLEYYEEGRNG